MSTGWDAFAEALESAGKSLRHSAYRSDPMSHPLVGYCEGGPVPPGSSLNFDLMIRQRHPELVVPEREMAYGFVDHNSRGVQPVDPETGEPLPCPVCGDQKRPPEADASGRIDPDSRSCIPCCYCLRTEWDDLLAAQRRLAGLPPAEERKPADLRRELREQRRKARRERQGIPHA